MAKNPPGVLEINSLEIARFGIVAARLTSTDVPLEAVNAAAAEAGVRMVTVRVEASDLSRVHALEADGYRLMDTLVYYARSLEGLPASLPLPEGISLRLATPSDASTVAEVARAAFAGYFGHYHADPRLDDVAADAAYVEWAETSTARSHKEAPVLIAERTEEIIGFATIRLNSREESEGVLFGIHPNAQRGGLYSAFIVQAMHEGRHLGAQRMIVSTQITNAAVQRVWARQGFAFDRALYTFHKWFD